MLFFPYFEKRTVIGFYGGKMDEVIWNEDLITIP